MNVVHLGTFGVFIHIGEKLRGGFNTVKGWNKGFHTVKGWKLSICNFKNSFIKLTFRIYWLFILKQHADDDLILNLVIKCYFILVHYTTLLHVI